MSSPKETEFDRKLGTRVDQVCYRKLGTQSALSRILGKNPMWVNGKCSGRVKFSAYDIFLVAKALGVSVDYLMEGCDDNKDP